MPIIPSSMSGESSLSASSTLHRPALVSPRNSFLPNRLSAIVDLSAEGKKAALGENGKPKVTDSPMLPSGLLEHLPLKELISRYNFESVTTRDVAALARDLYLRNEISADARDSLIQIAVAVSVLGHPNKLINFAGHVEKRGNETAVVVLSDPYSKPESVLPHYRHAKRVLKDLRSFVDSDRTQISTHLLARWPAQAK